MGKLTLVLGGARSGKSNFAMERAKKANSVLYIATYRRTGDKEMEGRIKNHKKIRPKNWKVVEEPIDLSKAIKRKAKNFQVILIDCITLWISNLILKEKTAQEILEEVQRLMTMIKRTNSKFILVSNEVGLGVVPDTKLGREFRDIAGMVNQIITQNAHQMYFMVAGIPMKII